ncbi:MAG: SET domain-containing protein-lysine N-methyltransferase [Caldilineaceae bacterium]
MYTTRESYLSPKLEVRVHSDKGGMGVFAREPILANEVLAVWSGRIYTYAELRQLASIKQQHSLQVEEGLYLTTGAEDEPADYINHSCNPNAGLDGQIVLRAMRTIEPDEEICYDYAMSDGSPYDEFECTCGAPNCRRYITGKDWQRPDLQKKYAGWFASYLQRRIDQLHQGAKPRHGFHAMNGATQPYQLSS